jgi:hypothetical protein
MTLIPENYVDFLHWVKETTEAHWSIDPKTSESDFKCKDWLYGAKWLPLTETQIDEVEEKYAVSFPFEHRAFLRILHTLDRHEVVEYEAFDTGEKKTYKKNYFYNLLTDEDPIKSLLYWTFEGMWADIAGPNQVWLRSWGPRPDSDDHKKEIFKRWLNQAPTLLPITPNHFSVNQPKGESCPILWAIDSDVNLMALDLKDFILNELFCDLGLAEKYFDEEHQEFSNRGNKELQSYREQQKASLKERDIPFWKEMILIWSSGWSSLGLEWDYEDHEYIVKTYDPEGKIYYKLFCMDIPLENSLDYITF